MGALYLSVQRGFIRQGYNNKQELIVDWYVLRLVWVNAVQSNTDIKTIIQSSLVCDRVKMPYKFYAL